MRFIRKYFWLIATVALLVVNGSFAGTYTDITDSMDDTVMAGDTFLVLKSAYGIRIPYTGTFVTANKSPAPGDIVVFVYPIDPSQTLVKRCVAVAGQTVRIEAKKLFVDGEPVALPPSAKHADSDTIPAGPTGSGKRDFLTERVVPEGSVFVLGDNRDYSVDSRIWGFLPCENIRGKAVRIIWSFDPGIPWSSWREKLRRERFLTPLD